MKDSKVSLKSPGRIPGLGSIKTEPNNGEEFKGTLTTKPAQ